ncbi:MAG: structural protein [Alphaproteobacteria bacterium]|nr:structural protein [Alphaproteobacteria bacterium]
MSTPSLIKRPTRGLKNHNPGNLRHNPKIPWQGLIGPDKKGFCLFDRDENGIRAMVIDLHTDYVRDHQRSVLSLIAEYAPPVENNTKAYATYVADRLGVNPLDEITFDRRVATALVDAIIKMENGIQPYPAEIIAAGVEAAFDHFDTKKGTRHEG